MAKDRIILAFLYLFYIVKIIEKRLFYEQELGSLESKLQRLGIEIFLNFLTLKTF